MFERYTERARRVLFFARYEASQLGSINIETEHLLLGLIREGKGLISRIVAKANVSLVDIRRAIEGRTVFREKVSTSVEIPFSAQTKRVLQFSAEEADGLGHNYIGTEHLLLGLLREERSVAASILGEAGLSLEQVRDDIKLLAAAGEAQVEVKPLHFDEPYPQHPLSRLPLPLYVPSTIVHISLSRHPRQWQPHLSVGPQHWLAANAPLRYVVARLHHVRDEQVHLSDAVTTASLDVVLVLPTDRAGGEGDEALVLRAIEEQLRVRITRETSADGDVVTVSPVE